MGDVRPLDGSGERWTDPQRHEAETARVRESPASTRRGGLSSAIGTRLSRYVLLEDAGQGAMGRVFRAYDPKLQREVALKELRAESLDREAAQRLVREARAMAKLSHPNVVAVYDVEELESGDCVLVMEFVAGQTLGQWLGETERDWPQVVEQFLDAGRGLQAAHRVGLLHRDFKPANVLVATTAASSGSGRVKVTDFGLAKAAGADSTLEASSVQIRLSADASTEAGLVLGTPRYMAPEQHRGHALTQAADQYAFCVALWEALCGTPPFCGTSLAAKKAEGPPPWPPARGRVPRRMVDAIVRGLSVNPADRWPSVEALLEALSWDPARRRNRWLLTLSGLSVFGLGGLAWDSWAAATADRCTGAQDQLAGVWDDTRRTEVQQAILAIDKSYAPGVWARTHHELDRYAQSWASMHIEACEATTVRREQSAAAMDLRMACLHGALVEVNAVVDQLASANAGVVRNAHKLTGGLRPLSRCADVEALQQQVEPPLPDEVEAVEQIRALLAAAKVARQAGRYSQAKETVELASRALVEVTYGPVQTEVALAEGNALDELGQYQASDDALQAALALASRWRQWDELADVATKLVFVVGHRQGNAEEALRYAELATGLAHGDPRRQGRVAASIATVLHGQGRYDEAEVEFRRALALRTDALGPDHPIVAHSMNGLANVLEMQGKIKDAEVLHRRALALREAALGPGHPDVAISRVNLANALHSGGKYEEGEAELRRGLVLLHNALGPEHPFVAASHANLANILVAQGEYEEANTEHRQALTLFEKTLGINHPDVAQSRNNLANLLTSQGKHEEAETEHRRALALFERALGPDHPNAAMSRNNLALALQGQKRHQEAETEHRRALALREAALGPDHPDVAESRNNLATVLEAQGKYEEAEAEFRRSVALWEKVLGPDHPSVAASRSNLAHLLVNQDRSREALGFAEEAWSHYQRNDIPPQDQGKTAFVLARALWATRGDRTRARTLAQHALEAYIRAGDAHDDMAAQVEAWLEDQRP